MLGFSTNKENLLFLQHRLSENLIGMIYCSTVSTVLLFLLFFCIKCSTVVNVPLFQVFYCFNCSTLNKSALCLFCTWDLSGTQDLFGTHDLNGPEYQPFWIRGCFVLHPQPTSTVLLLLLHSGPFWNSGPFWHS